MNSIAKYLGLVWLGSFLLAPSLFGAGNDNPGGVTAEFYGNITTAGNYDPYTGNARREITDIVVPGTVGAYPLKYTRSISTRSHVGWTGNYDWSVSLHYPYFSQRQGCNPELEYCDSLGQVSYPNGGGTFELLEPYPGEPWHLDANGRNGAKDLLFDCAQAGSHCTQGARFEIWRADGGKVLFQPGPIHSRQMRAYAIIDPYGQRTTLTYYDSDGHDLTIWKVTESGGRYLEFIYNQGALCTVQANDGQGNIMESVHYAG